MLVENDNKWKTHALSGMFWSLMTVAGSCIRDSMISPRTKFWVVTNWSESRPNELGTFLLFVPGDKNRTLFEMLGGFRKPSEWCRVMMWQPPPVMVGKRHGGLVKQHTGGNWQDFRSVPVCRDAAEAATASASSGGIGMSQARKWNKIKLPMGVQCNTELPMYGNPRPNLAVPAVLSRQIWTDAMRDNKVPALWSAPPWNKNQILPSKEPGTFVSHEGKELLSRVRSLVMGMERNKADWIYGDFLSFDDDDEEKKS